jgi:antitoxin component HigA of HigAB toxin-antitoxin module
VRIISKKPLCEFWEKHPDAKEPLLFWYRVTKEGSLAKFDRRKAGFSARGFILMTQLVERYEDEHHPIPEAPPHVVIQGLMQDRGLRNKDLEPVLGGSSATLDVISGNRSSNQIQVDALAKFFSVSPELFVSAN